VCFQAEQGQKFRLYRPPAVTILLSMLTTSTPLRPRTSDRFSSLMELYERNYMLVRLLAPRLREMDVGEHVSRVDGAMSLELSQVEHDRYTSTFNLTYRFSSGHRHAREPDLAVRLYHDARTCEVMSGLLPGETVTPRRTRDLRDGWRLNRFLHRWLGYCLRQGHGFGAAEAGPNGTSPGLSAPTSSVVDVLPAEGVGADGRVSRCSVGKSDAPADSSAEDGSLLDGAGHSLG